MVRPLVGTSSDYTDFDTGDKPFQKHVDLGSWFRGEEYAKDIIQVGTTKM